VHGSRDLIHRNARASAPPIPISCTCAKIPAIVAIVNVNAHLYFNFENRPCIADSAARLLQLLAILHLTIEGNQYYRGAIAIATVAVGRLASL
jgi:hypothetical protein